MATYKEIRGTNITAVDSDPTNITGEIFYNNASRALKAFNIGAASWSTGGNLNTARMAMGGAGIQTAALVFGGGLPSPFKNKKKKLNMRRFGFHFGP